MKIKCGPFKKWIRVLEQFQEKGDPIRESLYLDFEDEHCYFQSNEGIGKMKFYFEKESEDEKIENFFVSTDKFLNIISQYDEISLDENFVFSHEKDVYKLAVITNETFDKTILEESVEGTSYTFEKEDVDLIARASTFTNKDEHNLNFRNVFIKDGYICALTTPTPLYEGVFSKDVELAFSLNVAKTIQTIGVISEGCLLTSDSQTSNKKIISKDGEFELIVAGSSSTDFPPNRNEDFIERYSYGKLVTLDTQNFAKSLSFMKPYYLDVINAKITFSITEDGFYFKVVDSSNEIKKHIDYIECSPDLIGKEITISAVKVEQALGVLRDKILSIELDDGETDTIVRFFNDESQQVLITRFAS